MKISWNNMEQEWRKQLISYAKGSILEVGVEAGDNFKHYPIGVHVTATDSSARMIEKAKAAAQTSGVKANFIVSPEEALQFEDRSFDTIISTFSLSAYENPAFVLDQFSKWCKPNGMILLLEYGLSKRKWVNWIQNNWEPYHYRRTGSHINRDLISILCYSSLRIKRVEEKLGGSVNLIWASLAINHK